ncbi:2-hydroxyacyl-CoA dehydratase subunit D, partial [Candidatus Hydrogenedentota bacterium]
PYWNVLPEQSVSLFIQSGCRPSEEAVRRTVALGAEATDLWKEVLELQANKPAPLTAFDTFFLMAPIVTMRGEQRAIDFYQHLVSEVRERIGQGIGALDKETHRLLWENIPIWYRLRNLSEQFSSRGANFVMATYTDAWAQGVILAEGTVFERIAAEYQTFLPNLSLEHRFKLTLNMIDTYSITGIVIHSNHSCKPYSLIQPELARKLRETRGIPILVIDSDMCDPRFYSDAQVSARVEAFMETLEGLHCQA